MKSLLPTCLHFYHTFVDATLALFYPQRCLHCGSCEVDPPKPLCHLCTTQLTLLSTEGRCQRCFTLLEETRTHCNTCRRQPSALCASAAALDYAGPAATLVKGLKYNSLDYLATGMGAFMAAQLIALQWPWPDYLIPVPMAATHLLARGYNQSTLLANSIGAVLGRPISEVLSRYSGDYSQAGLSRQQRLALSAERFVLRADAALEGKCLLIVDDVMTTGQTLTCCADVLAKTKPKAIYAITFCRALE